MRAPSILAFCLVAASAKAYNFGEMVERIQDEIKTQNNAIVEYVNGRLDKIAAKGVDAVGKARDHLKEKSDALNDSLTEPLKQARANHDECLRNTDRHLREFTCFFVMGHDVMTKGIPIVSENSVGLIQAIYGIAEEFSDKRETDPEGLRSQARNFADNMYSALRECMSNK